MASEFTDIQKGYIWSCIKFAIDNNSGIGFLNADQGHPAYLMGENGAKNFGDSPDQNEFFKLVITLDSQFRVEGQPDLSTWEGFCKYAHEAYIKATKR